MHWLQVLSVLDLELTRGGVALSAGRRDFPDARRVAVEIREMGSEWARRQRTRGNRSF